MAFTLDNIVPWGRSFAEYVDMFGLSDADLKKRILGCGDGPAGFNAELTRRGGRVVSVDPAYRFTKDELESRIGETFGKVMEQTTANSGEFVWEKISSPEELGRIRMGAMRVFLEDYDAGLTQGRYVTGELPTLPFEDDSFGIALCSHLLFLYSEQLTFDFHLRSIKELCRVAGEVRIFPLLELGTKRSRHLDSVITALGEAGYKAEIVRVSYEFQRGGNEMLRVSVRSENTAGHSVSRKQ